MTRRRALLALLLSACGGASKVSTPPPAKVVQLDEHHGADVLFGGASLLESGTLDRDPDADVDVRISAGRESVAHSESGWPLGVAGDRAYLARLDHDELVIQKVGLSGQSDEVVRVPKVALTDGLHAGVAGDGSVGVIVPQIVVDDGNPHERGATLLVIDATGAHHELDAGPSSSNVVAVVGDPRNGSLALVTRTTVQLVATATGTVTWSVPSPVASATNIGVSVANGRLLIITDRKLVTIDLADGRRATLADNVPFQPTSAALMPDGQGAAITHSVHQSDMPFGPSASACAVYVATARSSQLAEVVSFNDGCPRGVGLLYVDGVLWVAPP